MGGGAAGRRGGGGWTLSYAIYKPFSHLAAPLPATSLPRWTPTSVTITTPGGWKQLRPCPPPHFAVQWRPGIHQLDFPCLLAAPGGQDVPLGGVKGTLHRYRAPVRKVLKSHRHQQLRISRPPDHRRLNFTEITEISFYRADSCPIWAAIAYAWIRDSLVEIPTVIGKYVDQILRS